MVPKLVIHTDLSIRQEGINSLLEKSGLKISHPNLLYLKDEEKLGIAQAKTIIEHLSLKPFQDKGQAVVIESAHNLTTESQNALLKSFEEAPEEAVIILGANSESNLLTTILSRCHVIQINSQDQSNTLNEEDLKEIEELLKMDTEKRFQYVEKQKEKEVFLEKLLLFFREKLKQNPDKKTLQINEDLLLAQKYLNQNVNPRTILEYLMFTV